MQLYTLEPYSDLNDETKHYKKFIGFSGRSSGKTEQFARKMYSQCDKYQKSFIVIRDKTTYLKTTIWRTLKRVAKDIGVDKDYYFPESLPLRIVHKSGRYSIDLYGIEDDSQKLKGYEGEGKSLCGCWFEEFGNISSKDKIDDVEETIARSMDDDAIWLYSGNPPKEANAWSRIWVEEMKTMPNVRVFETTFADIWNVLSEQNKDKIRLAYMLDKDAWEFKYLGKPYTSDGLVYNNFNEDKYVLTNEDKLDGSIIAWAIGVDVAVDRDKTVGVLELKLDNGRIITRALVEHNPKEKKVKLTVNEQAMLIDRWYQEIIKGIKIGGVMQNISLLPHAIIVDQQDFGMTVELKQRGLPAQKVEHKNILRDIERGKTLMNCNRMYFIGEKCKPLINELQNIMWRNTAKTLNIKMENYGTVAKQQYVFGADDCENAWRYAHCWLLSGDYVTYILPPLKEYNELKEINVMQLTNYYTNKGVVRDV